MNSTSLKQNGSGVSGRLDRPLFCFVFLVILATLFRIALPFFREYIYSDTVLWIRYADQIRHLDFTPTLGEAVRPVECLFQYPPGYSLFIALFSLFLRDLILSSLAVSFFFGVINPFLVYLIGKKVGNRYVGFLAGVIACFHHVTVKISCNSLIRTTVSFFFLLAILALFKFLEEPEKKRNGLLLGTAIFAVYLCRFELGILYGLILVLFILYYFLKNGMKEKTRSILFVFLPLLFLFLVHSFLMFKFTGRFLSEYLVGHVKPVAALNRGISEAFGGKRPPSPYPALEREPSYFREARGKMEHVPFYRKCLETVDSFFESYEMILVILFIILSLKFREIRLGYRYEELFYGLFVLTLFFFAAFVLVLRTRYLFQLLYLVFILYSRLILFLA